MTTIAVPYTSKPLKKINVLFLVLTPLVVAAWLPIYLYTWGFAWDLFALFAAGGAVSCLCITAGYHRLLTHRSYQAKPWVRFLYLLFGTGAYQGSALIWVADHRRHHRFVDTEKDPHNIREGFFHAHMGWLLRHDNSTALTQVFAPDMLKDRAVLWQHKYYVPLSILTGFLLPALLASLWGKFFGGLLFGGLLRICFTQHCTFFINSLAHTHGSQPYDDTGTARDSFLMAVLAYGEGYHNFHHRFQADYRNGIRWYHWDPTKWVISALSLLGWASDLRKTASCEILGARLLLQQKTLLQAGLPESEISALKQRVETAQHRFKLLREDYKRLKSSVRQQSGKHFLKAKAEMKIARLECKMAVAQWAAYFKTFRPLACSHRIDIAPVSCA